MHTKALFLIILAFLAAGLITQPARADGIIIPEPPVCLDRPCPPLPCLVPPCPPVAHIAQLVIRYHRVQVSIQDQLAVTHVDQVFYNPNDWQVEGDYVFPLPLDAAVSSFTLWIDGQAVKGEVLEAGEARQVYEDIVRRLSDPALLEYADRGALRARIFPIPPQGERRIELEYSQVLTADNSLVRYTYPLNTEKFSALPLEQVSIDIDIRSSQAPLRAVYSPSHPLDVTRAGDSQVHASYEASDVRPDTDFTLYYSLGDEQAFHLLSYRDPLDATDPDGFFLLLLAASPDAGQRAVPKDVILVLDRSGSMEGEKFQQAQQALRYVLNHLGADDRFNIITFSSGVEQFASRLQSVDAVQDALEWVDRLAPAGSTDINRALLEAAAMAYRERPAYLIFLTDGLPTAGVTDSQAILQNIAAAAPGSLRLFPFGVGYDVDTLLLDSLAQEHHGLSSYVLPGERLDEILSSFYERISTPVLTDLRLDFGDLAVYDLYPDPLPDLFVDTQIVVVGRYRRGAEADILLQGIVDGETRSFEYADQRLVESSDLSPSDPRHAIPRLWATRKIGYLLNQIRLNGPDQETIDQIVRLSIRYGIVTPYTSYLVTEEMPLGAAEQQRIAEQEYNALRSVPAPSVSGQAAVEKAADQAQMAQAESLPSGSQVPADLVRTVAARTFVYQNDTWVDTAYDPQVSTLVKINFLSDAYFELARRRPDAAAALALGPQVIVVLGDQVYQVVSTGGQEQPKLPEPLSQPTYQAPSSLQPDASPTPASTEVPAPGVTPAPGSPATPAVPGSLPCASPLLIVMLPALAMVIKSRRHF